MVIEWVIDAFISHPKISGVAVGLSKNNDNEDRLKARSKNLVSIFEGGEVRSKTVMNGLQHFIDSNVSKSDWAIIHDSNRPFVTSEDIDRLIESIGNDENGGVMCLPVHDTVKHSKFDRVTETLPRQNIFRAQTPQMFKVGTLLDALQRCVEMGVNVSDESQAIELYGLTPQIVMGSSKNLKITTQDDWLVANALLNAPKSNLSEQQ